MNTFYNRSTGNDSSSTKSQLSKNQDLSASSGTTVLVNSFLKKMVLLVCMVAGLWQFESGAQTNIFVGTGTVAPSVGTNPGSGANGASPYGICVGSGSMGKKMQIIYTAAQINAAMTAAGYSPSTSYINSVSWDISAHIGVNYSHAGFTIKMANVPQTSFTSAATPYTGSTTTVFGPTAQTYGASGTGFVTTHTLTTPFQWDGTSSLLVEVCYTISGVSSASTYGAVRRTTTASNQMIYNGGASITCATASYVTAVAAIPNARFNVSPATPCSGAPLVGTVSNATPCPQTSATLTISGLVGASGYSYQWLQSDAINGTYVNASGTSTNSTYVTPTSLPYPTTYYKCDVTCSGQTTRTNAGTVTNANFITCYCTGTYAAANGATRGITNVSIGSPANPVLNNSSTILNGGAGATSYTLYTAASPVSNVGLTVSSSYTLAVTVGSQATASNNVGAWIDYNQNGIFETTEFLGSFANSAASSTTNINFTVSATALAGTTAMRVRHRYGGAVTSSDACTNFAGTAGAGGAGETEDYRVVLTAACVAPSTAASAVSATNILTTSADLGWTNGSGDGGRIVLLRQASSVNFLPLSDNVYSANSSFGAGTQLGTGNYCVYNGTGSSVSITGLLPSTTYFYSIFEYNSLSTCYTQTGTTGSFTTASCSPSTQPSLVSFCPEYTALNITAARGNGTHTIIIARAGSAVNADPAYNTSYAASTVFGSGDQVGSGNYVIYNGSGTGNISLAMTGLTAGVTYHFRMYEYNASPNCYNLVSPATFTATTRSAGVFTSSTTTQNTTTVSQNTLAQQIIGLQIVMGGGVDAAATVSSITFNTTGSTNATNDIVNARIFYTGTSSTFAATTQYGATFTSFSGNLTATDNFALSTGTNYFWIAYDLKLNATVSNVLDATIVNFVLTDNSGTSTKIPSTTAPAGSRSIISSTPSGYCIPSPAAEAVGDYITAPTWSGGDLAAPHTYGGGTSSGSGVNNKTAQPAPTLTPGVTYNLNYYAEDFIGNTNSVWIDWNQSGTWDTSAPELVRNSGASFTVNQSVTVPLTATPGATRMRIINRFPTAGTNACVTSNGSSTSAVYVDYTVIIAGASGVQAVSCATPVPTVTTPVTYNQNAATSQLSATGTGLLWYTAPTGGTGSSTAPTPSSANTGTTMYYVSQNTGCESPRTQIAVTITGSCGFNIVSAAIGNGVISPAGTTVVQPNGNQTYTFTPDCGYRISAVLVDGLPVGTPTSYTFTNVTAPHTISVSFALKTELCNGIDDDCDGLIDEGCPPPLNDTPAQAFPTAISGNIYPNCGLLSGTLAPATHAVQNTAFAGVEVWYKFIAQTNAVSITMNGTGQDNALALYSNSYVLMPGNSTENAQGMGGSETLNYDGLTPGVEYVISAGTVSGPGAAFTFCLRHLTASFCADGSGTYQLCSNLKAQFTGATTYTYYFTPTGATGGSPTSITSSSGQLPLSTVAIAIRYGGTYNVRIDANYQALTYGNGLPDSPITVQGTTISNITIAPHPVMYTKETQQCPATLLRGSIISAKPFVCAATSFNVEFTKVSNCSGTTAIGFPFVVTTSGSSSNLNLSFSGPNQITPQSYYRVRWQPNFSYGSGTFGNTNVIFIGGSVMDAVDQLAEVMGSTTKSDSEEVETNLYPNPNTGEMVNLNMTNITTESVLVRIMDGMGRVIYSKRYTAEDSLNTIVTFAKPLAAGMYLVEFTDGENVVTEKMIVE